MKWAKTVLPLAILALLIIGFVVRGRSVDTSGENIGVSDTSRSSAKISQLDAKLAKKRGPRPAKTRLRNGAMQLEDIGSAIAMAKAELKKVESLISSTSDAGDLTRLTQQKHLIQKTIIRLNSR